MSAAFRIAWRASDNFVTAFLVPVETMEGATELLRISHGLRADQEFWADLKLAVQHYFERILGDPDQEHSHWKEQKPPEERA
jgi:hypothetical protein